jgi:hypothetical protein
MVAERCAARRPGTGSGLQANSSASSLRPASTCPGRAAPVRRLSAERISGTVRTLAAVFGGPNLGTARILADELAVDLQ